MSSSVIRAAIENLESRTLLSAGLLDTTFNLIGKQTARYSDTTSDGVSVRFQADHKAIVVGDVQNGTKDAFISRWNEDGTPDTTYGTDTTKHATFLDLGADEIATDVDIQSDGKAVVCGLTGNLSGTPTGSFFVARFNTDGTLDTTFNASGSKPGVRAISIGSFSAASGITIDQSTGRITVVGAAFGNPVSGIPTSGGIGIAFLNSNGTMDTSVGGGSGTVVTTAPQTGGFLSTTLEGATDVVPGPTGHFYVSGFTVTAGIGSGISSKFLVAEFNNDGTLTTSFGTGGRATATFSDASFTGNISLRWAWRMTRRPERSGVRRIRRWADRLGSPGRADGAEQRAGSCATCGFCHRTVQCDDRRDRSDV